MPLTKGLRDEENERINNILNRLMSIVHVPGGFPETGLDAILKELGLTTEILLKSSGDELTGWLQKLHFDWENAERFADFLLELAAKSTDSPNLKKSAIAIYQYIQNESKSFSFGIAAKIANAQK